MRLQATKSLSDGNTMGQEILSFGNDEPLTLAIVGCGQRGKVRCSISHIVGNDTEQML